MKPFVILSEAWQEYYDKELGKEWRIGVDVITAITIFEKEFK